MIVTCERCSARYKLDDSKIKGRGARITCPKCQHVFVVYNKAASEQPDEADPEAPSEDLDDENRSDNPLAQDADNPSGLVGTGKRSDQLDFRKVGISTWKVKVKIGLVYDFSDIGTLRKYIQDRRVTEDDVISHDGSSWVRIGDIPDLDAYFVQVYEELEDQLTGGASAGGDGVDEEADTGEEFEDGPTMVVGMGSLRSNISTGVFARPGANTDDAPPSTRPLPGKPNGGGSPTPDANRFVDPFESLKERQRDRMRAKRRSDGGVGTGSHRKNGKGKGKGDKKPVNVWLIAAGVMGLLAVGWYFFLRTPPQPVQPADGGHTVQQATEPQPDPEKEREELLQQLQQSMRDAGVKPELDGSVPEDNLLPAALSPQQKAEMCRKGELTPAQCQGVSQGSSSNPIQSDPPSNPEGVSAAPTSAADHARNGANFMAQRQWSQAAAAYGLAARMDSRNAQYRRGLADALLASGQYDRAKGEYTTLANAGDASAKLGVARCLAALGDDPGANAAYNDYLKAFPNDGTAKQELQELLGQ
jgi:predicted Zn finger-like uncharacterized protein